MILFMICDLFTMNIYDGKGRKTSKYIQTKTKEKIPPFGCPPIPPSTKMEADCFPVSETSRCPKQAGPTLGGKGALVL